LQPEDLAACHAQLVFDGARAGDGDVALATQIVGRLSAG